MDLEVWKLSKEFAKKIYLLTNQFPDYERYGLTQQIRRAAVSVMSNIAEGSARRSAAEFCRFINMASGSLCELESQLMLAIDLNYGMPDTINSTLEKADRISKMLYALHRSLSNAKTA